VHYVVKVHRGGSLLARLGIIAARKAIPRAVDRNACKRVAREAFRQHEKALAGLDIVVICRAPIAAVTRGAARLELNRLFTKAAAGRITPG
jgi:ribonuclease P protein component